MRLLLAPLALLAACGGTDGGGAAGPGAGTISGSVMGVRWTTLPTAYWIGKPSAGAPPVIIFLFDTPMKCSDIGLANWDKIIGNQQVLEIGLPDAMVKTYQVKTNASVAYLRGFYNPDADQGTVTLSQVTASTALAATVDVKFGSDALASSFSAAWCPGGTDP